MYEQEFNLLFNLNKSYVDIGIEDTDVKRLGAVYGIPEERVREIFAEDHRVNSEAAAKLMKPYAGVKLTARPTNIVYLGDSITSYRLSHRAMTQCILEAHPNFKITDLSISGYKVTDIYTAFYPFVSDVAPNIAVIMIGTNDMRITEDNYCYNHTPIEHYKRDLDYTLEKLAELGCKSIAVTLPPVCMKKIRAEFPERHMIFTEEARAAYNGVVAAAAKEYGAELVDMRGIYEQYDSVDITIDDGLHLNPRGHYILEEQILKRLMPLISE